MVVTITTPPPGGIGLGLPLTVSSSLPSLPGPSIWIVDLFQDAARTLKAFSDSIGAFSTVQTWTLPANLGLTGFQDQAFLEDENPAYVRAQLVEVGNPIPIDTGTAAPTFKVLAGQNRYLANLLFNGGATSTLNPGQSNQLTDIQNRVQNTEAAVMVPIGSPAVQTPLSSLLIPTITSDLLLQEITSGPTGSFVGASLGAFVNSITVRIVTLPPGLTPLTPDADYYLPTLATMRIYHSSDLFLRVPIHTTSKIIELQPSFWGTAVTAIEHDLWPDAVTLQVEWLAGVTGRVYKSIFP